MSKKLKTTIEIEAPLLTKASVPGLAGLDAVMARNSRNEAVLHDRHIKGRLREAWTELGPLLGIPVANWLGSAGGNRQNSNGSFVRGTGLVKFSDFIGPMIPEADPRVRVEIDQDRRAAKEHMLQMIESPFKSGGRLAFTGCIECEEGVDIVLAVRAIKAGLYWSGTCGGMRTAGFGRIVSVDVSVAEKAPTTTLVDTGQDQVMLWLTADKPVCATESRAMENLYVSGQTLPGGMIKGAVASTWLASLGKRGAIEPDVDPSRAELSAHFDKLRFAHARPSHKDRGRPRHIVPPLSIGRTGSTYRDYALSDVVRTESAEAVAFQPDWKDSDYECINQRFGTERIRAELRVSTAVDSTKRRAEDAKLYALQVLVPEEGQGWITSIDFGLVPEGARAAVRSQLFSLVAAGIGYLGKTKATLNVELINDEPESHVSTASRENVYILTLQTAALLGNPDVVTENHASEGLHHAYAADFDGMSRGALKLVRFFARQFLQGGLYLHKRFLEGGTHTYQPYLLTAPGSAFVLQAGPRRESEAADCIREWARYGLPPAPWSLKRFARSGLPGDHWTNHPYLRENGFGEVAVNLSCHFEPQLEIHDGEARNA